MHDRRRSDRIPLKVKVNCRVRERDDAATVYDVSVDGCMVETSPGFAGQGDTIVIMFRDDVRVPGTVIWTQGRNAGVCFAEPMRPAVMEHLGFTTPAADLDATAMRDHFGRALPRVRGPGRSRQM